MTFSYGQSALMADLDAAAAELTRREREVASGKRLEAPSDDPSSWAAGVRERGEIASADQYTSCADSATSRLTVVDTVLSDLVSKLTAARSSVLAGQGTIQTASQREAIAQQLEGICGAVFDDLNTTFGGTYLFSGSNSLTPPYTRDGAGNVSTYMGDLSTTSVDVSGHRSVQVSLVGSDVTQGSAAEDIFTTLRQVIAAVRSGDQTAMADGAKALEAASDRVTNVQTSVGTSLSTLDDQKSRLSEMKLASQTRLSKLEDANMAESITAMEQANTAYETALSAIATRTRQSLMDYLS